MPDTKESLGAAHHENEKGEGMHEKSVERPEKDPLLHHERTHGDKSKLRESLVQEAHGEHRPIEGLDKISPEKLIHSPAVNTGDKDIQAAKNLNHDDRVAIIEEVLKKTPDIDITDIKNACKTIDIDPEPFVKKFVDEKTEAIHQALENEIQLERNEAASLIQIIKHLPEPDINQINQRYEEIYGLTIQKEVEKTFRFPEQKLEIEVAMMGTAQTREEAIDKVAARVAFEREQRERLRYVLVRPLTNDLYEARTTLDQERAALTQAGTSLEEPSGINSSGLEKAKDAVDRYLKKKTFIIKHPALFIGALIAVIGLLITIEVGGSKTAMATVFISLFTTTLYSYYWQTELRRLRREIIKELYGRRVSSAHMRALIKSKKLKEKIK